MGKASRRKRLVQQDAPTASRPARAAAGGPAGARTAAASQASVPWWMPAVIVLAGFLAYSNIYSAPFIFDDSFHIVDNVNIRSLWPIWTAMSAPAGSDVGARPVVNLTLAVNHAISGLRVWSYHLVNVLIHVLAALTLFGVARRTLRVERLRERYGASASVLALAVALLWVAHPLNTQAVTYTIQRAESLMGLWYLSTVYAVIRSVGSTRPTRWHVAAVAACALGMATKPIMATAPLVVLCYDRLVLSSSWRDVLQSRGRMYFGLFATLVVLGLLQGTAPEGARPNAGFDYRGISPFQYLLTQTGVMLHYLKLSVWPVGLCLDYNGWPVARSVDDVLGPALAVGALLLGTGWAIRRRPALGFLGVWFFGVLAPTSSIVPIADVAFEHRMYLPLIAVLASGVFFVEWVLRRLRNLRVQQGVAVTCLLAAVGGLVFATVQRNHDYRSGLALWEDVVAKRPDNPRGYTNLCEMLAKDGRVPETIPYYEKALAIDPNYWPAHDNLGLALLEAGRTDEAVQHWQTVIRLNSRFAPAYLSLGGVALQQKQYAEAVRYFQRALQIDPSYTKARDSLAFALAHLGRRDEAIAEWRTVVQQDPGLLPARLNLAEALAAKGNRAEAQSQYEAVLRLDPGNRDATRGLERLRSR